MKIRNVNKEKINSLSKGKMIISACVLSGILTISGCSFDIFNTNSVKDVQPVTSIKTTQTKEEYELQIHFNNLEYLQNDDIIGVYDADGNIYAGYQITTKERSHVTRIPVEDCYIYSEQLGTIKVHIDSNKKACIYIDYLNKTINYQSNFNSNQNKILNNKYHHNNKE